MPEAVIGQSERLLGISGPGDPNENTIAGQGGGLCVSDEEEQGRPLWPAPGKQGRWHQTSAVARLWKSLQPVLVPVTTLLTAVVVVAALFRLLNTSVLDALENSPPSPIDAAAADGKAHSRDPVIFLHPEEHVRRDARTINMSWNITKARIAPDGVYRDVVHINGQFPGPSVEARTGDVLVVEVYNCINESVSLHWHGLHMRGANHMDGPVGVNQCAIPPGGSFVYTVPTGDQAGTFWYHAHSELQRADGLYGGLVIHAPAQRRSDRQVDSVVHAYDKEVLLLIGDWYHFSGQHVYDVFQDPTSNGNEPVPDSVLVNGMGAYDCRRAVKAAPIDCQAVAMPWFVLDKALRYRVRIVNVGSLTGISTIVADATLKTIQIDGGLPVVATEASSVGVVYPAQRVDYILSWPQGSVKTDAELIVSVDEEYYVSSWQDPPSRTFRIESAPSRHGTAGRDAKTISTARLSSRDIAAFDLRDARGPRLAAELPVPDKTYMIFAVVEILSHNHFVPKGYINHTMWIPQTTPLLALDRTLWDRHQLVPWTGSEPVWVELTINNIDTQGHPFHLHGFDFYVVASHEGLGGWDYYNPFAVPWNPPRGGAMNVVDPLKRDTIYVPPYGYAVLQFRADNQGIWVLHCHILWHQASGMNMAFQVMGDEHGLGKSAAGRSAAEYCKAMSNI